MRVLVAHAGERGSTASIAERIGRGLERAGCEVVVRPASEVSERFEVSDRAPFDAMVVGSAIHGGAWLPAASDLLERWAQSGCHRPVWLFSVSSVGDSSSAFGPRLSRRMRRARPEPEQLAEVRRRLPVRGHRNFAGVVARADWGLRGDLFVRLLRGRYGDHRDWPDVDAWAEAIAADLTAAAGRGAPAATVDPAAGPPRH